MLVLDYVSCISMYRYMLLDVAMGDIRVIRISEYVGGLIGPSFFTRYVVCGTIYRKGL